MSDTSSEPQEPYRANLQQTPLPEILSSIQRHRVAGVVKAINGDQTRRLWVRDGAVEHATSSNREDALPVFLRRKGLLTAEQFTGLLAASRNGKSVNEALLDDGALSPLELLHASAQHVESIVASLFGWEEGTVQLTLGDFEITGVRVHLPLARMILSGIQQAPAAKALVGRLGRRETILVPIYRGEELVELGLDGTAYELLRLVDGKRSLYELCTKGPLQPPEAARLLYAFHVLHLIRRTDPERNTIKLRYRDGDE